MKEKKHSKKWLKYVIGVLVLGVSVFGFYLYKLHALAVESNNLFERRCTEVNPPLIEAKKQYLKFVDVLRYPDKYTQEESISFLDGYIEHTRKYIIEENKWLRDQKKYLTRWDFQLIEPWYMKEAGKYQWEMYDAQRDDNTQFILYFDKQISSAAMEKKTTEAKVRYREYSNKYFDLQEKARGISDWRKAFGRVPIPSGCTEDNLTIPDTSGALDWTTEDSSETKPAVDPKSAG